MQYQQVSQASPTTETKGHDIVTLINDLCDSDYLSYPPANKVLNVNVAYEELIGEIINADGTWQYDDTNHTDHPVGKGTLVEGQEAYSFTSEYLQIEAVEVLDDQLVYRRLKPLDHQELGGDSPQEYFGVDSSGNPEKAFPEYFDQVGDTIRLYPAPSANSNVTLANGLRVWFKRTADLFTVSDTTQSPGLPSTHHWLLAYKASITYCMKYKKDRLAWLEKRCIEGKKTLIEHYSHREKAKRQRIKPIIRSFR